MNILDSKTFRIVMYFKLFMVIVVWGLVPLFIPTQFLPFFGLNLSQFWLMLFRIWGALVLLDSLLYIFIFKFPHVRLTKYLIAFGILDNAGVGIILLILTFSFHYPWGVWINIPFQLFFGYWFTRFLREGNFDKRFWTRPE